MKHFMLINNLEEMKNIPWKHHWNWNKKKKEILFLLI